MGVPYDAGSGAVSGQSCRPKITWSAGKFWHNGCPIRVVFRKSGMISIGCSDVSIDAARELVRKYDEWCNDRELVVQP